MRKVQFRCPSCLKKLFSWKKGEDFIINKCDDLDQRVKDGFMLFRCPKCKVISKLEIVRGEAELVNIRDPIRSGKEQPSKEKLEGGVR